MIIALTPEIEAAITEQARQQETTPERLVSESLEKLFAAPSPTPDAILGLAAQVYAGLSEQDVSEMEKIVMDRGQFVGQRRFP